MSGKLLGCVMVVALVLSCLGAPGQASAQTSSGAQPPGAVLVVTTLEDELNADGDCSLREALRAANLNDFVDACGMGRGDDTIRLPRGIYRLSIGGAGEDAGDRGDLDILDNLRLVGGGAHATVIDAAGLDRALHIHPGQVVAVEGVTIAHGLAKGQPGGGILNVDAALTLSGVALRDNTVAHGLTEGGGGMANVAVHGTAQATLIRCTVAGNAAFGGGGLQNAAWSGGQATLALSETTVDGNRAQSLGGGIWSAAFGAGPGGMARLFVERSTLSHNVADGGASIQGHGGGVAVVNSPATLVNSTLSGNQALGPEPARVAGLGGGLFAGGMDGKAWVELQNVTLAGNRAVAGGAVASLTLGGGSAIVRFHNSLVSGDAIQSAEAANCLRQNDGYGENAFVSDGHNLEDGDSCGFDQRTDLRQTTPRLGSLADNGGPTQTHALRAGSPALNAGDEAASPPIDQRGVPRPQCACSDIGAFEAGSLHVGAIELEGAAGPDFQVQGRVQALDWGGAPVDGVEVQVSLSAPNWGPRAYSVPTGPDGWTPAIRWASRRPGTFRLCVDSLVKDGYVFGAVSSMPTCRAISLP